MIAHVSDNIILKIAPRHPGHYEVIEIFVTRQGKKIVKYNHIYEGFKWFNCSFQNTQHEIFVKDVSKYFESS